ncbi:hypothetical protein C8Q80DRAFT_1271178 [Daedaleopsis nitida]|nr:hypothetical protein C8Q80DRAFT_1271178 [Daedaleopsis nitida]
MTTQDYTISSLVGGQDGTQFSDIYNRTSDGSFVLANANKSQIDPKKPFASIEVYHGEIIDGIAPTYNLKGGGTATMKHGSGPAAGRNTSKVTLTGDEIVVGVFGKAGRYSGYGRDMVVTISFAIFNKASGAVRVEGPYGDMNKSNQGTPYYTSDPMAFGGFANDSMAALGLGGLTVYKSDGQK